MCSVYRRIIVYRWLAGRAEEEEEKVCLIRDECDKIGETCWWTRRDVGWVRSVRLLFSWERVLDRECGRTGLDSFSPFSTCAASCDISKYDKRPSSWQRLLHFVYKSNPSLWSADKCESKEQFSNLLPTIRREEVQAGEVYSAVIKWSCASFDSTMLSVTAFTVVVGLGTESNK